MRRMVDKRGLTIRVLLFVGLFAVCAGGIAWLSVDAGVMETFQRWIARITSAIVNAFGGRTIVSGNVIQASGFALSVVNSCTGIFTTGVFLVGVLAYPASLRAKLIGVGMGMFGVFIVNIVRLVSLFYIGVHFPRLFDKAHLLVWQSLIIVFALFLWLIWAGKVAHAEHRN